MKPIKSGFDMTPQEQTTMFSNASVLAHNTVRDITFQLIQKGAFKEGTKLEDLTKEMMEAAKPIREFLTTEAPKSRIKTV